MINIGIEYIPLHWHYWVGAGTCVLINILIMTNQSLYYQKKWTFLVIPIIAVFVVFGAMSILSHYLGW